MTARAIALALVAVLGLVGCTTGDTGGPPSTMPSTTPSTTPSARDSARPTDRDEDAVLAAVRQLDLCALLDRAKAGGAFAGGRPVARRPFECVLSGAADLVAVSVTGIGHRTRVESVTRAVGGAKAYVEQGGGCYVHLPVSFTTALRFSQVPASNCESLTGLAGAAVAALADPDAFRAEAVWDACTALADALDADEAALSGNGPADCTSREPKASISFADDHPPSGEQQTSVGDTRVRVFEEAENCAVYWRQGPFDVRYAATTDYQVVVRTSDCDGATDLAESLMAVLEEAPPDSVAAQRQLLYQPDEPDSPYPGACAYVDELDPKRCAPYVEVAVPDGTAAVLGAATDDADVQCALAVRAVGAGFGSELVPVADSGAGNRCFFVEPKRQVQLTFSLAYGRVVDQFGGEPVTVAGHPGFVTSDSTSITYDLSTGTELDGEGNVTLRVSAGPANAGHLAPGTGGKAESTLADILRRYFS
jgi:hypothetical protein